MADYYKILGVGHNADDDTVKKAYRKLAMQHHPDKNNGSPESEAAFKALTEAYDVLRDPDKRSVYDRYGEAGLVRGMQGFHHVDLSEALNIFLRDMGGFEGVFTSTRPKERGEELRLRVHLTLAEVMEGVNKSLAFEALVTCSRCEGIGAEPGTSVSSCPACKGSGQVQRMRTSFLGSMLTLSTCSDCQGKGKTIAKSCSLCKGQGRVKAERTLDVTVPAGVETGQFMNLRGQGNAGIDNGGQGDLILVFEVEEDPRFQRHGEDILTELAVTYCQLALGDRVEVPNVIGNVPIIIPPGTQSGHIIRLSALGLPRVNASTRGDLYVQLQAQTPTYLSGEETELLRRLQALRPRVSSNFSTGEIPLEG